MPNNNQLVCTVGSADYLDVDPGCAGPLCGQGEVQQEQTHNIANSSLCQQCWPEPALICSCVELLLP